MGAQSQTNSNLQTCQFVCTACVCCVLCVCVRVCMNVCVSRECNLRDNMVLIQLIPPPPRVLTGWHPSFCTFTLPNWQVILCSPTNPLLSLYCPCTQLLLSEALCTKLTRHPAAREPPHPAGLLVQAQKPSGFCHCNLGKWSWELPLWWWPPCWVALYKADRRAGPK